MINVEIVNGAPRAVLGIADYEPKMLSLVAPDIVKLLNCGSDRIKARISWGDHSYSQTKTAFDQGALFF